MSWVSIASSVLLSLPPGSHKQQSHENHIALHSPSFVWKGKSLSDGRLFATMDFIVHGILQVRILDWVAFPFSRGSSQPRDRTPALQADSLPAESHGKPIFCIYICIYMYVYMYVYIRIHNSINMQSCFLSLIVHLNDVMHYVSFFKLAFFQYCVLETSLFYMLESLLSLYKLHGRHWMNRIYFI